MKTQLDLANAKHSDATRHLDEVIDALNISEESAALLRSVIGDLCAAVGRCVAQERE